jgi:four helix bundle protein
MKDELGKPAKTIDLKTRTQDFALRIIHLYSALPRTTVSRTLGNQALRAGTSIGAHYREATRSRSNAEFISKIELGIQELDETIYWLELIVRAEIFPAQKLSPLISEANELIAIMTACAKNAKLHKNTKT